MKRFFTLIFGIMLFGFNSCDKPGGFDGPIIPQCDFSEPRQYTFGDFSLRIPRGTTPYFEQRFPLDKIVYDLNNVLEVNGDFDYTSSNAEVRGKAISDGYYCKGENPFVYKKGSPNVLIQGIIVDVPSNTTFEGEVKVVVRTDDFREVSGSGVAYYVRWETVENDGDSWINGNLLGEKKSFDPYGDLMLLTPDNGYIYNDGSNQPLN